MRHDALGVRRAVARAPSRHVHARLVDIKKVDREREFVKRRTAREERDQPLVRHLRFDAPPRICVERENIQVRPVFGQRGDRGVVERDVARHIEFEHVDVREDEEGLKRV